LSDSKARWDEFKVHVKEEFINHLPYTFSGVVLGVLLAITSIKVFGSTWGIHEFHMAHFTHVFFSGAASAAIFRAHHDSTFKAVIVAFFSAVILCAFSDVLLPIVGLKSFGYAYHIHLCALEHPATITFFVLAGISLGLLGIKFFDHCNRSFHLVHLLISTAASTIYMLGHISDINAIALIAIACTLFFALAFPCLVGDMVLPLCFVNMNSEKKPHDHDDKHNHHDHAH
jgi:hypothetical protein